MKNNKASETSILISKSIVIASNDPNLKMLVNSNIIDINFKFLKSAIGWKAIILKIASQFSIIRFIINCFEKITVPGIKIHYLLRKRKIEEIVQNVENDSNEFKQIVIIGAGGDSLGLRIAQKNQNINVFEIDHPDTQIIKKKMFNSFEFKKIKNFNLIPADLSKKELSIILSKIYNFNFNEKTIFIAEGLFMYLPFDAVKNMLKIINLFPKSYAKFIFTYMEPNSKGLPAFSNQTKIVDYWLRLKNEPLIWGLKQTDLDNIIKELGFLPGQHFNSEKLKISYLNDYLLKKYPVPKGEVITYITT